MRLGNGLSFWTLMMLAVSCGQKGEILPGSTLPVLFDPTLQEEVTSPNYTITGECELQSNLTISGTGFLPSPINVGCSNSGTFSEAVVLQSPDGIKNITVRQVSPSDEVTFDNIDVLFDQTPPNLVDDMPGAVAYSRSVLANVIANDDDGTGAGIDPATITLIADSPDGSLTGMPSGSCGVSIAGVTFTPDRGFSGTSACIYGFCDYLGQCSQATVVFTVNPGSPVVANDDVRLGIQGQIAISDVLDNDGDPDGEDDVDKSTLAIVTNANPVTEGTCITGPAADEITFTPVTNYHGTASCTYQICDFESNCDIATANFTYDDQTLPLPVKDVASMSSGGAPLSVDVSTNDTDPANNLDPSTVSIGSAVGGVCDFNPSAPVIRFTPNTGFIGTASCNYSICDQASNCATSLLEISVSDGTAPIANPDFATTEAGQSTGPINLASNDSDVENQLDLSSVTLTGTPVGGACSLSSTSPFVEFVPTAGFAGTGSCNYQICDNSANCSSSILNVAVLDRTAPTANDDPIAVDQNVNSGAIDVSANDSDPEGNLDASSVTLTGVNSNASCVLAAPNVTLTPDTDFAGIASCEYRICDTAGNCSLAELVATVSDVTAPTVTMNQLGSQADPAGNTPIVFEAVFSEVIDTSSFSPSDIDDSASTAGGGIYSIINAGDNKSFTIFVNGLSSDGVVELSIGAGSVLDVNGLGNLASTSTDNQVTYDGTAPLAPVITGPDFTQDTTPDLVISCEPTSLVQISVAGMSPDPYPAVAATCPGGGSVTLTDVPFPGGGADGDYNVVPIASDLAGNQTAGNAVTVRIDNGNPDVVLSQLGAQSDPTAALPIFFTATFSEAIDPGTFEGTDINNTGTAGGGVWTVSNTGDNTNFILSVSAIVSDGTVIPQIAAASVSDIAGNTNNLSSSGADNSVNYDGTAPGAPIVTGPEFTQDDTPDIVLSCDGSEDLELNISGYASNPVSSSCSGGVATIALPASLGTDGPYSIVPTAIDGVGNRTDGNAFTVNLDRSSPTPTIVQVASQDDPTNSNPIFFEVSFDEAIDATSFSGADISNSGTAVGGIWSVSNSGDDTNFTISVNALTGDGTVIPQIGAALVSDYAGNTSNTSVSGADNQVIFDNTGPAIPVVTGPSFTSTNTPTISVNCETGSLVQISIGGYTPDPAPVTPVTCVAGTANILLPAALASEGTYSVTPFAEDSVGNRSTGSAFSFSYDETQPAVTIARLVTQADPTNTQPILFDVVFSEAIDPSTFSSADITNLGTATGGVWTVSNSGDNQNFSISIAGLSGDGTVQPQIAAAVLSDFSGNTNTVSTTPGGGDADVVFDGTAPGIPVVTGPDYTNVLNPTITLTCEIGSLIQLSISTYTPDPFPASPLTCSGGNLSIPITPNLSGAGNYSVTAFASDAVGNVSQSAVFEMIVDQTSPDVTVSRNSSQNDLTNSLPLFFDVVFSEAIDPLTFTASDILNTDATTGASGLWSIVNSGDNQNFSISLSALTVDGVVVPTIPAGNVSDLSGNTNTLSTTPGGGDPDVQYDGTAPAIPVVLGPEYTSDTTPSISVSCEVGTDVQISVSGYTPDPFPALPVDCTSSPVSITLTTALAEGVYSVTPIASDDAGNQSVGTAFSVTVDETDPDVTITRLSSQADPTSDNPAFFSVSFDEKIDASTFSASDITDIGTLGAGVWSVTNSGDDTNFIISITGMTGDGSVEPTINASLVSDLAANLNTSSTTPGGGDPDVEFDDVSPTSSEILAYTWALNSPGDDTYSSDGTPELTLSGAGAEEGGRVHVYTDTNCVEDVSLNKSIAAGGVAITDITFATDGSADGEKVFYVRLEDEVGNTSSCTPIGMNYVLDTIAPTVTVNQASTQADPATDMPIVFEASFSEEILASTFVPADISNTGTITGTFSIFDSGDSQNFTIFFEDPNTGGSVIPNLGAGVVTDLAGNTSLASTSTDNEVFLNCVKPDTVEDLYHGPITQTTADLFWENVDGNGCAVTDYEIEYRELPSGSFTVVSDGIGIDPQSEITTLDPSREYEVRVRAYNGLYGDWSNVVGVITKPTSIFFDPVDYKLINLAGATNSQVVALEDSTDIYIRANAAATPTLLVTLQAGQTHGFTSSQGEILSSDKPIFCAGKIGTSNNHSGNNGNPAWVSPLWAEKELLFNASRGAPQQIHVFAFEPGTNVEVFQGATSLASVTGMAANTFTTLVANSTGSFRIVSNNFIVAHKIGRPNGSNCCYDDMPALPKSTRLIGFPSTAGYIGTAGTGVGLTIHHSDGFALPATVSTGTFYTVAARGATSSLYDSEAVFVESDSDPISGNNTADSDGLNSAPFAPLSLMMRRYAINVLADYVAFAGRSPANIRMTRPDGTTADFQLARTGTGPFSEKSPYKYYLENIPAGTRFEGIDLTDRFSVWYQPDTNTNAGRYDETIIYGYK